jgi:hypothetical protein
VVRTEGVSFHILARCSVAAEAGEEARLGRRRVRRRVSGRAVHALAAAAEADRAAREEGEDQRGERQPETCTIGVSMQEAEDGGGGADQRRCSCSSRPARACGPGA